MNVIHHLRKLNINIKPPSTLTLPPSAPSCETCRLPTCRSSGLFPRITCHLLVVTFATGLSPDVTIRQQCPRPGHLRQAVPGSRLVVLDQSLADDVCIPSWREKGEGVIYQRNPRTGIARSLISKKVDAWWINDIHICMNLKFEVLSYPLFSTWS